MRYLQADDETFVDSNGKQATVKATLPMVGRSSRSVTVRCGPDVALDEVVTRPELYGAGAEPSSYLVFEENATEIFEARLDMGKVGSLRVPL